MVIKSSAGPEVRRLIEQLAGDSEMGREAAIARLAIVGTRAVQSLLDVLGSDLPVPARAGALRALEAIGDRRALAPALGALEAPDADPDLGQAAVGVVRGHLTSRVAAEADRAFERLTEVALDPGRPDEVRLAALDALDEVPGDARDTLRARLTRDASPAVRARARGPREAPADHSPAALEAAAAGELPDTPEALEALIAAQAAGAPLATLHRLVGVVRARESSERGEARTGWLVARAAVHQALAARRSTVALYDLRETLEAAKEPLPVGFLAALAGIGDASCLEPLAAAYACAKGPRHDWWRTHLASAFQDIVRREHLTRRHAAVKKVLTRWPDAAATLLPKR
jgi:hypothetical protein